MATETAANAASENDSNGNGTHKNIYYEDAENLKKLCDFLRSRQGPPVREALLMEKRVHYLKGGLKKMFPPLDVYSMFADFLAAMFAPVFVNVRQSHYCVVFFIIARRKACQLFGRTEKGNKMAYQSASLFQPTRCDCRLQRSLQEPVSFAVGKEREGRTWCTLLL